MSGSPGTASVPARALAQLVRWYQVAVSPLLGPRCRFVPSCSEYALVALRRYGAARGGWLTARRLARCHPFHSAGYDPVPPAGRRAYPPTRTVVVQQGDQR